MAKNRAEAIPLTSIAGSSLSSSYAAINASGLNSPCFKIVITNTTAGLVTISYDGVTDHDIVRGSSSIEISSQTNAQPPAWMALFAQGTVVYVKGSSGSGNVYLSGYTVG